MKNFNKKLTMLLAAFICTVSVFSCEKDSKSSVLTLDNYKPNLCVRLYQPADKAQAYQVLKENNLEYALNNPSCVTLVYEEAGLIKGVCIFGFSDGYAYRVVVGKDYQRKGIGSALLHEAMKILNEEYRINEISLYSEEGSVGFYKKLGFKVVGKDLKCILTFA